MSNLEVIAEYPTVIIYSGKDADFSLDVVRKNSRTCSIPIYIKGMSSKYADKYLNSFTIGFDEKGGYRAFANSSVLSDTASKKVGFGFELGDAIVIAGKRFTISKAPNNNIRLEAI